MSPLRALATVLVALAASIVLTLAIRSAEGTFGDEPTGVEDPSLGVDWDYRPADLADLTDATPATVVAEVQAVRAGEPVVAEPTDGGGEPFTAPTELVDLRVIKTIDGSTPESFTLFKLGAPEDQPAGDPAYVPGEQFLLFVRPRLNDAGSAPNPDGTYITVAPDGRLERTASGHLDAEIQGPVARELDGATIPQATEAIEQAESDGPSG